MARPAHDTDTHTEITKGTDARQGHYWGQTAATPRETMPCARLWGAASPAESHGPWGPERLAGWPSCRALPTGNPCSRGHHQGLCFPTAAAPVPGRGQPEARVSLLDGNAPGPGLHRPELPRPGSTQNRSIQGPPGPSSWARSCLCVTGRSPPRSPASLRVHSGHPPPHHGPESSGLAPTRDRRYGAPLHVGDRRPTRVPPQPAQTQPVCPQRRSGADHRPRALGT